MLLSLILAWITVIFGIMTSFKYVARVSKSAKCNRFFHKIHIPVGTALVLTGLVHGLLAGNFADTKISETHIGTVLFSLNWGSACFIVSVLLGLTYLMRRVLKKQWMRIHRILTVCFLILVVIHVADVGIQLPARLFSKQTEPEERLDTVRDEVNDSAAFSGAILRDVGVASFFSGIKALYGKSENELPVKPEDVYMNAQLAEEFAGEKYAANLYGRIYRQTTDSDKWAVLLHPNQLNGGVIADKIGYIYYELGYNILAPDQRGFGKSEGKLALGCLESMDIYDWLCKLNEDYDPKHIVVHGLSLGGAAVNFLSGIDEFMENGPVKVHELSSLSELHVDGLIVDSSYIDMQQFAGKKYLIRHGTGLTEENVDYYSNAASSLCYAEIPMMVIHGTKDLMVSPDNADKIAECLKTPPRCWKADGEWHVFVLLGKRTEEYREKVQEFLMGLMQQEETGDGHRTVPCPEFTQ